MANAPFTAQPAMAAIPISIIGSLSQQDGQYALLAGGSRIIGTIIPNVVVEEVSHDEMTITEHPVETGAIIADHAIKRPVELDMRCAWSNSTGRSEGYVQMIYQQLLHLQAQREPMTVYTPKRMYTNMLISGISVNTDGKSEFALNAQIRLKEVIITNTSMMMGGTPGAGSTPNQAGAVPSQMTLGQAQLGTYPTIQGSGYQLPASVSGGSTGPRTFSQMGYLQ